MAKHRGQSIFPQTASILDLLTGRFSSRIAGYFLGRRKEYTLCVSERE
jgi:hypothetical protein